jgi:putative intracellular protease/amidase
MSGIGNMKIAVLATEGLEQVELTEPLKALRAASADVAEIAAGQIRAGNHREKGKRCRRSVMISPASQRLRGSPVGILPDLSGKMIRLIDAGQIRKAA